MAYGFSSVNQLFNLPKTYRGNIPSILAVRVKSIVLNETHPRFEELGSWNALGVIEYESVVNPEPNLPLPTYVNS